MRILALIPARGGSKRLPGKNIRSLGGKPLINWTIEVARGIPEICEILVSTDDAVIASIAKEAGAAVPWLRPIELATDEATSVDVALHALDWFEAEKGAVDGLLLLQPTSPFRRRETVQRGIQLFEEFGHRPVLGVSHNQSHLMLLLKQQGDYVVPFLENNGCGSQSQGLPQTFVANGSFYLIAPEELRRGHSFLGQHTVPLVIDSPREALDIDTKYDYVISKILVSEELL